jgi:hypothetical protein
MASIFSKLRGTIETIFQFGLGGPQLKNNAGAIDARNAGDSAFAIVRGAAPVGDNDLTNKQYVDTLFSRSVVTAQFDGNNALPANTGIEHFYVVSTTGPNATIGQLLWDDGSGVGTAIVLPVKAQMIITAQAFSGGTVTFKADTPYVWDTVLVAWQNAGGSSLSGSLREIRYAITNAATQDSANQIPANAFVVDTRVEVTTPYSGGATISVGQAGSLTLLQLTTDNLATVAGIYQTMQDIGWGAAALAVRTTVGGAPAAGAGFVIVQYTIPDL